MDAMVQMDWADGDGETGRPLDDVLRMSSAVIVICRRS